jgi:hypothetical protein
LQAGSVPFAIAAADIDVNGDVDLAVANQGSSSVSVYGNNGNRTFSDPFNLDVGGKPLDILAFETQFISDPVIVTVNPAVGNIAAFYLGNNGFFGPDTFTAGTTPRAAAAGDFDGDGNTDLAVANFDSGDVTTLLSDGFGGFNSVNTVAVGPKPQGIVAVDLDNDGKLDLAVTNGDNNVIILKGAGNGGFTKVNTIPCGNLPIGIVAGDFNKDGKMDLAVASNLSAFAIVLYNSTVSILINQGNDQFAPQALYSVEAGSVDLAVGDFNKDGFPDLVVANEGPIDILDDRGSVSILFNRGDGTFGQDIVLDSGFTPSSVAVGDFDHIGAPDIAVTNRTDGTVSIFFNE